MPRFSLWTERTGAHAPRDLELDGVVVLEGGDVRAVLTLDDDDGITLHLYGNVEIRSTYLPPDESAKFR
jgi:hypothetical protein